MENPFDMLKNISKLKDEMKNIQSKLDSLRETVSVGGDMVSVTLNGQMQIVDIKIDPSITSDVQTLQVLIASAVNTCNSRMVEKVKSLTSFTN